MTFQTGGFLPERMRIGGNYCRFLATSRRAVAKFGSLLTLACNRKFRLQVHFRRRKTTGIVGDLAGGTILNIRNLLAPFAMAIFVAQAGPTLAQGAFPAPLPGQVQQNDPAFPPVPGQATVQRNDPAFPPVPGQATVQRNDPAFPPVPGQATVQRSDPAFPPVNGGRAPVASVSTPPMASFPAGGAAPLSGGFTRPPPPQQQAQGGASSECMKQFIPLRDDTEKRGKAIKAASDRHASPQEACKLIGMFNQAELKMMKYVEKNSARCGIPAQVLDQLKTGHKNSETMLKKVCDAAQQAQRAPAGPTLSDVLGSAAALPEATTRKKGGSTFDTLSGNVLTR